MGDPMPTPSGEQYGSSIKTVEAWLLSSIRHRVGKRISIYDIDSGRSSFNIANVPAGPSQYPWQRLFDEDLDKFVPVWDANIWLKTPTVVGEQIFYIKSPQAANLLSVKVYYADGTNELLPFVSTTFALIPAPLDVVLVSAPTKDLPVIEIRVAFSAFTDTYEWYIFRPLSDMGEVEVGGSDETLRYEDIDLDNSIYSGTGGFVPQIVKDILDGFHTTWTIEDGETLTLWFKKPVYADELEVFADAENVYTQADIVREWYDPQLGVWVSGSGTQDFIKKKITGVRFVNISGGDLPIDLVALKKYKYRGVFLESGAIDVDMEDHERVMSDDIKSAVLDGTPLTTTQIQKIFDQFDGAITFPDAVSLVINFKYPQWLDELETFDGTPVVLDQSDIKREWILPDGTTVVGSGTSDYPRTKTIGLEFNNVSGGPINLGMICAQRFKKRGVFLEAGEIHADIDVDDQERVLSDDVISADDDGTPLTPETIKVLVDDFTTSYSLVDAHVLTLGFKYPIWLGEFEVFEPGSPLQTYPNASIKREWILPDGSFVEGDGYSDTPRTKVQGVVLTNQSGGDLDVALVSLQRYKNRGMFLEEGEIDVDVSVDDQERVLSNDLVSVELNAVPLTQEQINALFDELAGTLLVPQSGQVMVNFKYPMWLEELEVFENETHLHSNINLNREWWSPDGNVWLEGNGNQDNPRTKVTRLRFYNDSGGPLDIALICVKRDKSRTVSPKADSLFDFRARELFVADEIDATDSVLDGSLLTLSEWKKLFVKDEGLLLPDTKNLDLHFTEPLWIDEFEVLDNNNLVAHLGTSLSRTTFEMDGSSLTDSSSDRKTLIKRKILGFRVQNDSGTDKTIVISGKKFKYRAVFPEEGATFPIVADPVGTAVNNGVDVAASSTNVLGTNAARKFAVFTNDGNKVIYLFLGSTAVLNRGIRLNPHGGFFEINMMNLYTGEVNAIKVGAGTERLCIVEG